MNENPNKQKNFLDIKAFLTVRRNKIFIGVEKNFCLELTSYA